LSKVINDVTRRLKNVLPKLIDKTQSAFLEGRWLNDEVLVANEMMEKIMKKKYSCIIMKIYLKRAYNSIR